MQAIRQIASCDDLLQRTRICFLAEVGAALALLQVRQRHHETIIAVLREVQFVRDPQRPSQRPHALNLHFEDFGLSHSFKDKMLLLLTERVGQRFLIQPSDGL